MSLNKIIAIIMTVMIATVLLPSSICSAAETAPIPFWAASTSYPGDVSMFKGENLDAINKLEFYRLDDGNVDGEEPWYVKQPLPEAHPSVKDGARVVSAWFEGGREVDIAQKTSQSIKFIIPEGERMGVYSIRASAPGHSIEPFYLNYPDLQWSQGNLGEQASPGGSVRLFGKNLHLDGGNIRVVFEKENGGELIPAELIRVYDSYSIEVKAPSEVGKYMVYTHNGYGGKTAWSAPVEMEIVHEEVWPSRIYNVRDYGAKGDGNNDDTDAVRAALWAAESEGGGVVYFPRGRYRLSDVLQIPTYTVMRGENRETTQIYWTPYNWEHKQLPAAMIRGTHHFAVEDVSIHASRAGNIIQSEYKTDTAGHIFVRRITVRVNPFAGHMTVDLVKRIAEEIEDMGEIDVMKIGGNNIQIIDCDLYGSDRSIDLVAARGAIVKGNKFYHGFTGWLSLGGPNKVIFEDNEIMDMAPTASGNSINNLGYRSSKNYYFSRNKIRFIVGNDREPITSDGGGGVYHGPIASVDGDVLTLPNGGKDTSWVTNTWIGAAVFILSGKGAGQYREITSHTQELVEVDSPFTVQPDETSMISITAQHKNGYFVGNTFEDTGTFQFYGTGVNMVMAQTKMTRGGGMNAWGRFVYGGFQPNLYVEVVDNEMIEGNYFHWYGGGKDMWTGPSVLKAQSQGDDTLNIGTILRRNTIHDSAYIGILGGTNKNTYSMADIIVDDNRVSNADRGIVVTGKNIGVLLYRNKFSNVAQPMTIPQSELDGVGALILNSPSAITVNVNGSPVDFNGVFPFIDGNNRTMVPVRAIAEIFGANVNWESESQQVRIDGQKQIILKVNSNTALVDGAETELDTSAVLKDDRVFVPVRFIGESMDKGVEWNGDTRTITIY